MEYSHGVKPYILEWYNEVFLVKFNDSRDNENNDENGGIGLTTKELPDATFRIKSSKFSTQQINENYVVPLINAGYIDKMDNKKDCIRIINFGSVNLSSRKELASAKWVVNGRLTITARTQTGSSDNL
jgi:hypothetical protein